MVDNKMDWTLSIKIKCMSSVIIYEDLNEISRTIEHEKGIRLTG